MARPNSMLESMFRDIASSKELHTLKEKFYSRRNWGGAATYMLRKILPVWGNLINKKYDASVNNRQEEKYNPDAEFEIPQITL